MKDQAIQRSEHILSDRYNQSTIVLELNDGVYFELNESGTEVWNLIPEASQAPIAVDQLLTKIKAQYDPDLHPELCEFVYSFIEELEGLKLITAPSP